MVIIMSNPFMQYKQQSINTMSSGELVVTLFDEIVKNLNMASKMLADKNIDVAMRCTEKSKKIITHLIGSLDFNYDVSQNLYQLYNFFNQQIIVSEVRQNPQPIDEILPLITDLKQTWSEAQKIIHIKK